MTPLSSHYQGSKAPGALFAILLTLGVNVALFATLAWVNHRPVALAPLDDTPTQYPLKLVKLPKPEPLPTVKPPTVKVAKSAPPKLVPKKIAPKRPLRLAKVPVFPKHVPVNITVPAIQFAPSPDMDLDIPGDAMATSATGGTANHSIADESEVDTPPSAVYSPNPRYPLSARKMGYTGRVTVELIVTKDGNARDLRIKRSSGHRSLDQSALDTIERWRFEPARDGGKEVDVRASVDINFQIRDTD